MEVLTFFRRCTGNEVVKDVKIALPWWYSSDAVTLQVIVEGFDTWKSSPFWELQFGVFSETRGIRVKECASIPKGLENEFRSRNLPCKFRALFSRVADAEFQQRFYSQSSVFWLSTASLSAVQGGSIIVSYLATDNMTTKFDKNSPENDTLVLSSPPHMIIGVICHLKNVRRQGLLVLWRIPVLCSIFVEDCVCVWRNVFVWIKSNQSRGPNAGVYVVCHKSFAKTCHDDIVRNWRKGCEVGGSFQSLVRA